MHRGSVNSAMATARAASYIPNWYDNNMQYIYMFYALTVRTLNLHPHTFLRWIIIKITFIFVFDTFGAVAMESKFNNATNSNNNNDNDDNDDSNKDKQQSRIE